MMLKKEIKEKMKGKVTQKSARDDSENKFQDMGELALSDDYINEGDWEGSVSSIDESDSLEESDDEREQVKRR